jgi:hypothetical protein
VYIDIGSTHGVPIVLLVVDWRVAVGTLGSGGMIGVDTLGSFEGSGRLFVLVCSGSFILMWVLNIPAICLIALSWLVPMWAKAVDGCVCCTTLIKSCAACMATSVGVAYGTLVLVGNNSTVSEILVAFVLMAKTW